MMFEAASMWITSAATNLVIWPLGQMGFTYVHGISTLLNILRTLNGAHDSWAKEMSEDGLAPGPIIVFEKLELTESSKLLRFDDICCKVLWDRVGSSVWIYDWEWTTATNVMQLDSPNIGQRLNRTCHGRSQHVIKNASNFAGPHWTISSKIWQRKHAAITLDNK